MRARRLVNIRCCPKADKICGAANVRFVRDQTQVFAISA